VKEFITPEDWGSAFQSYLESGDNRLLSDLGRH
jgi:hypothetical protein